MTGFVPGLPVFFAAEIEVRQPGGTSLAADFGHGAVPHGALSLDLLALESTTTLRASDLGYRSRDLDAEGLLVFPPVLKSAFEIDRAIPLEPAAAASRAYGAIRLDNLGTRFDAFIQGRNADNRPARVLIGQKAWDPARMLLLDPPRAALAPFFTGVALPWSITEEELTIPLADPAAWLDRPVQGSLYAGTGGFEGGAALAGKPRPMTRGGTGAYPVRDVPLVLVDDVALIYQWTDGPGTVATLYEGGAAVFTYDGDAANLYGGSAPAPGHYRTDRARGMLQLGSKPVHQISADATGSAPVSGAVATPAELARCLIVEDMGMPGSMLDLAAFDAVAAAYPYPAGYYIGTDPVQGSAQAALILGSINGRLCATRSGLLRPYVLAPLLPGTFPVARIDPTTAVDVVPEALPASLDPPPYRWSVGYGRTWLVQTSDLNATISAARQQQLAAASRYGTWFSGEVKAAWRRPNDPAPLETVLLRQSDATEVAGVLGALFQGRPGRYAVTMPIETAAALDLALPVLLQWPVNDLLLGRLGQVVGEQVRSGDGRVTLSVLAV